MSSGLSFTIPPASSFLRRQEKVSFPALLFVRTMKCRRLDSIPFLSYACQGAYGAIRQVPLRTSPVVEICSGVPANVRRHT